MLAVLIHVLYFVVIAALLLVAAAVGFEWPVNVFRAADKTFAACLGFSGYNTLSAECGVGNSLPRRAGQALIDAMFGDGHCVEAAKDEGLL